MKEFCGIFGVCGDVEAARRAYLGLYALQHRGQESSGIAASDGSKITVHRGMGLVRSVFATEDPFDRLRGSIAIGHNR
ncbi:MAG TPA: hypothetical protein ENN35_04665 [Deltaproteobacteria bacterium]|nr:hypothetical protein [Deltaproteobacteria bacterium]